MLQTLGSILLLVPAVVASADNKRPNVIFILADDLGWGDLGCYGNKAIKTPNLDRLADEGTLFTQFYVAGSVCSPSRCGFLTGQYPARHRIHGHYASAEQNENRAMSQWLDPKTPTIASVLQANGYKTAIFGKWHLGDSPGAPAPSDYGFDEHRTLVSVQPGWSLEERRERHFHNRTSQYFVDEAIRFVRNHREQPFFLEVCTMVPHATLDPPPESLKPYSRLSPSPRVSLSAPHIYYASVTDLDAQIGRLLDEVESLGLKDDTIVVFSSDNGPEDIFVLNAGHSGVGSPGPLRGRKRSLYEGGVRVPFLVRWPGHVPAGRVDRDSVIGGVDLLPTLGTLCGVPIPNFEVLDGESRSQAFLGQPSERTKPLHWEWRYRIAGHVWNHSPLLSIREGKWKLLFNPDGSRFELYDIPADPMEQNNLAETRQDVVKDLKQKGLAWQKSLPAGPMGPGAGQAQYPWPQGGE